MTDSKIEISHTSPVRIVFTISSQTSVFFVEIKFDDFHIYTFFLDIIWLTRMKYVQLATKV